jgi:uncharacterized membrane protein
MREYPKEDQVPRAQVNKAGWRAVSVASVVMALSLVGALLAQDGLFSSDPGLPGHPDGLTTLALVLAILAFLVQIFVFVLQTNASGRSIQRSEELNTATLAVLSKIEANSDATQKVLFAQFDRLLDYVVEPQSEPPRKGDSADIDEIVSAESESEMNEQPATVADVQHIVSELVRQRDRPTFAASLPKAGPSKEDSRMIQHMVGWPSREEAEALVLELAKLSPLALATLTRFGNWEVLQRQRGERVGLVNVKGEPRVIPGLIESGLVKEAEGRVVLTDYGRELARMLPIGKLYAKKPDWYDEVQGPLLKQP